jgi:DNA-binding XRE family transcriptional regulator
MNAIQLRMARAAIGWGVRELAEKAGVTANTVTRIENGADAKQSTINALRCACQRVKADGCRESSPRQNRQGDREETISVAPSVPAALASLKVPHGTQIQENTVSTVSIVRDHGRSVTTTSQPARDVPHVAR